MKKLIAFVMILSMLCSLAFAEDARVANWAEVEPMLSEMGLTGDFTVFEQLGLKIWLPNGLNAVEVSEDDAAAGRLALFQSDDQTASFAVDMAKAEGMTMDQLFESTKAAEGVSDVERLTANGLDIITCKNESKDCWSASLVDTDSNMITFAMGPASADGSQAVFSIMIASLQPVSEDNTELVPDSDGVWRCYKNGEFIEKTGIVDFQGGRFFVVDGVLCSDVNGLAEYDGQWYFVTSGQIQTQYTGLALYDGEWFYVENGLFDPNLNGLVDYDGGRFVVANGRHIQDANGLWLNTDGDWYFLTGGQVASSYTGLVQYDGAWFYVINGRLATDFSGDVENDEGVFHVVNGQAVNEQ